MATTTRWCALDELVTHDGGTTVSDRFRTNGNRFVVGGKEYRVSFSAAVQSGGFGSTFSPTVGIRNVCPRRVALVADIISRMSPPQSCVSHRAPSGQAKHDRTEVAPPMPPLMCVVLVGWHENGAHGRHDVSASSPWKKPRGHGVQAVAASEKNEEV